MQASLPAEATDRNIEAADIADTAEVAKIVETTALRKDARQHPCAYRKSSPSILVMQSTQDRTAQNAPRYLGGT